MECAVLIFSIFSFFFLYGILCRGGGGQGGKGRH